MRVFITGATGKIGTHLTRRLRERGDSVVALSRRAAAARDKLGPDCEIVEGDPNVAGDWMQAVDGCDAVIHLAGEGILDHRWTDEIKRRLRDSRILGTANVVQALARKPKGDDGTGKTLVSASAIGYYGYRGDEELTEDSTPGDDFLARICVDWEKEACEAEPLGIRVARVRVGVVLDAEGGALATMLPLFRMGVGGPIGSGKQYMSWVHHADLVGILLFALDQQAAAGPLNGTAPHPATNKEFGATLGKVLGRPSFMPTPAFAVRLVLGEAAQLVVEGQRVLPRRTLELGYVYQFPMLEDALRDLLGRPAG